MRVHVRYWGQIRKAAGCAEETIELPGPATVADLVARLAAMRGGELVLHLVDGDGRPRPSVVVIVGDRQVHAESHRVLKDGDSIALLPPIAGGAGGTR